MPGGHRLAAHPRYPLIIAGNRDEFHERRQRRARRTSPRRYLAAATSWLVAAGWLSRPAALCRRQ
jgi:hypothetical protein